MTNKPDFWTEGYRAALDDAVCAQYQVELGAGCHAGAAAPVVSRHRTLAAALNAARKSDRLVAVAPNGARYQIPQQSQRGRIGQGITKAAARLLGWQL